MLEEEKSRSNFLGRRNREKKEEEEEKQRGVVGGTKIRNKTTRKRR